MCVTTGPPIRGDPISHSQAHIPLNPPPPAFDPFPEATSSTGFPTAVRKNQPLVPRSNIAGSWTRGGGYLDNHRNNWRCARAVRKRPHKTIPEWIF